MQTETRSLGGERHGVPGAKEFLEQAVFRLGGNADPGVDDRPADRAVMPATVTTIFRPAGV